MDEALKKRLETTKVRLAEIDAQLLEENVTRDIKLFRDLSKERANLEPVVEAYDKYLKLESDLTDSEVMIGDSDPEISAFGKEEHKRILGELEGIDEELKILVTENYASLSFVTERLIRQNRKISRCSRRQRFPASRQP